MPLRDDNALAGPTVLLLVLAGGALYVASRAAADALAGDDPDRPGRRALGHWLPIAATAFAAAAAGRPEVAVGLVFATSVAGLSLVLGILTYLTPVETLPASRRAWPFVLPAALLALIAGFRGHLTPMHAFAMLLLGTAFLSVWLDLTPGDPRASESRATYDPGREPGRSPWPLAAQAVLALALAVLGGWAAVQATARAADNSRLLSGGMLAATVLSPLLTLPVLGSGSAVAQRGHAASVVSTLVALALLNLCALLPLLALGWYAATGLPSSGAGVSALAAVREHGKPLPYPLTTWRVDTVVLTVLGLGLVPVAMGRWPLRRLDSAALIVAYALYMAVVTTLSART